MNDLRLKPSAKSAPFGPMPIRTPEIRCSRRADGSILLRSDQETPAPARSIVHLFAEQARKIPKQRFIARRQPLRGGGRGDWRALSYRESERRVRSIAQALMDRGCGQEDPAMVLSGPSIEHALFMLGAFAARAPYAPISPGYSLLSRDFTNLRHVFNVCRPRMIFADDGPAYEAALKSLPLEGVEVVTITPPRNLRSADFSDLLNTPPTDAVDSSIEAITPETHARILFTSGSTGPAKGVIHSHRNITEYIAQTESMYPADQPHCHAGLLSWLPWSHASGASQFGTIIKNGVTLYIDDGRPTAREFGESIRNLRELPPTDFLSVPSMFSFLLPALEEDPAFRDSFFSSLRIIYYGGASLAQDVLDRLQALAVEAVGHRVPITTKYGTTEAMGVSLAPWPLEKMGPIGVPNPGVILKLVPVGDYLELRVKGSTVAPGYLRDADATAKAFDEEGFFRTGDAVRLLDPRDPSQGLAFHGRVVENFKLNNGSWVSVGQLRTALISALGVVQDCVIAGHDRGDIRVLAWLRHSEAAAMAHTPDDASMTQLILSPRIIDHITACLEAYNAQAGGATRHVRRILLLHEPPTVEEITEKGYINQRGALRRRNALVDMLYASDHPSVIAEPGA